MEEKLLTTEQAAEILGMTVQSIGWLLRGGRLKGRRLSAGRTAAWLVDAESVNLFKTRRAKSLSTRQVAERFGVSLTTAQGWVTSGMFPGAWRYGARGHWRIPEGDVEKRHSNEQ